MRRILAPSFSDKTMRAQEPIIASYIDLLMARLRENCDNGALDLSAWYNWATFDVIGDLAFGESFHGLQDAKYHPFVGFLASGLKSGSWSSSLRYLGFPNVALAFSLLGARGAISLRAHGKKTLEKRMELGNSRPDFIEPFIARKGEAGFSDRVLQITATTLLIAGSETTASLLGGATYLLLQNPDAMTKLQDEVRSSFESEDEINFTSVHKLTYMLACLNEALRLYPPAAGGLPRVVPPGGATISGHYVPEGVSRASYLDSLAGCVCLDV
jgi:cytochrome P450